MMTVYFSDLKDYGQDIDLDIILSKYRIYFENDFSVDHVIYAIHEHCGRSKEIPRICDLMLSLKPEKPKISDAQLVIAQKWQERNQNWSEFTEQADIIKLHREQSNEVMQKFEIKNEQILKIAQNSIKRISG